MNPSSHSGLVEIRGVTWKWETLDPEEDAPIGDMDDDGFFLVFRTPVDPPREMRCVVRDADPFPPSEEQLRDLFQRAWAVMP